MCTSPPSIRMTNMCTHEMFPWQFDKKQNYLYIRQNENVLAFRKVISFWCLGGGGWSTVYDFMNWNLCLKKKKIWCFIDSQLLSKSMRREHVLMNASYELYLLLLMSRLRCDILLSTCRRKNTWRQWQNVCQCHEKLCIGQREGIFILPKKKLVYRIELMEIWILIKTNACCNFV